MLLLSLSWFCYMLQETSCGAVVFLKKPKLKYLLLNYTAGHWGFVKGNMEFNETEKETVLRELEEETGILNAKFIEGFKENITYVYIREGKIVHKNVFLFLVETNTSDIKISFEHIAFLWGTYFDTMNHLTFNNSKQILRKANSFLDTHALL